MNKTAQYMVKAAQLRAQADKLEKIALLLDGSDEVTGADLGIGAGALGLLGGGAYGVNKYMKHRAAQKAAAEAAQAAQAAQAALVAKAALATQAAQAALATQAAQAVKEAKTWFRRTWRT